MRRLLADTLALRSKCSVGNQSPHGATLAAARLVRKPGQQRLFPSSDIQVLDPTPPSVQSYDTQRTQGAAKEPCTGGHHYDKAKMQSCWHAFLCQ